MSEKRPGTKGKPDHQQTADEEAKRIGGEREVPIETPKGEKKHRKADAAVVDSTGEWVGEVVQVIRPNKGGSTPKREKDAARDIEQATGQKPQLVPVRPYKPPPPPKPLGQP